jgi:hypothetical protein
MVELAITDVYSIGKAIIIDKPFFESFFLIEDVETVLFSNRRVQNIFHALLGSVAKILIGPRK